MALFLHTTFSSHLIARDGAGAHGNGGLLHLYERGCGRGRTGPGDRLRLPLCPISIREFMKPDGTAGAEKPKGEIGEICFSGPQIFLGYLGDPENTAKTVSKDGDLLHGRRRLLRRTRGSTSPAGRNWSSSRRGIRSFPRMSNATSTPSSGTGLAMFPWSAWSMRCSARGSWPSWSASTARRSPRRRSLAACSDISAYSRPSHVVILKAGEIPLNRVAKTDYLNLRERAAAIVRELRAQGGWDGGRVRGRDRGDAMCGRFILVTDLAAIVERFDVGGTALASLPEGISCRAGHPRGDRQRGKLPRHLPPGGSSLLGEGPGRRPEDVQCPGRDAGRSRASGRRSRERALPDPGRRLLTGRERRGIARQSASASAPGSRSASPASTTRGGRRRGSLNTCTIITTESNPLVTSVHDRMPVVLRRAERGPSGSTLVLRDPARLLPLLTPYPAEEMILEVGGAATLPGLRS